MEICPSAIRKNPQKTTKIYSLICQIMANVNEQISDVWYNPPEGFTEDDFDKLE